MVSSSLNSVLKQINKKFDANIAKVGADALEVDGVLSLGSPSADYCLYGGIVEGRITEFSGAEGSGKTSSAFLVAASFQREELKRHPIGVEWEEHGIQHVGPRAIVYLDAEMTLDPTWARNFGYELSEDADVPTVVIRPEGQNAEEIFDMALDMLRTGEVGLLIFDSIATLVPAQIAEESMSRYQMGGVAKSLTRFANTAIGLLRKYKATLIGINQCRDNMSGYGNPVTTPGGRAWRHACSSRLMFKRGDFLDENGGKLSTSAESPAGHVVQIAVLKTKTSKWDRKGGSYTLNYTKGIDILADTIEVATHLGFIESPAQGSFILRDPDTGVILTDDDGKEIKIRGKNNIRKYFEDHVDIYRRLYDAVYDKLKQKEDPFIKSFEAMMNEKATELFGSDALNVAEED